MMSLLINYEDEDEHLEIMKDKLKNLELNKDQKIYLYFGIAKGFEDKKIYEEAFKYIELGNNLKHKNSNYKIEEDVKKIEYIKNLFNEFNFEENLILERKFKPIFILGMPRSGTSLVEQIISSHKNVEGLGELNYFNNLSNNEILSKNNNNFDLSESIKNIKQNYSEIIENYDVKKKIFTDKTLLNFNWIGLIKLCFQKQK